MSNMLDPAAEFKEITASDVTTYGPHVIRQIMVQTAGDLSLTDHHGNTTVFSSVPAYTPLNVTPSKVNSTDTTASGIVALMAPR
jgi:hypothetical protein